MYRWVWIAVILLKHVILKEKKFGSNKAKENFKAMKGLTNEYPKDIFLGHLRNKFESVS